MDIRKISPPPQSYDTVKVRREKEQEAQRKKADDSVELSPEAVRLFQTEEAKKIETVRERIQSGYYARREVVEKVADELARQFSR